MISGKAYSIDLREKVMSAVSAGIMKFCEIAKIFNVNVKTIYKWRRQLEDTGSIVPKRRSKDTYKFKINDPKQLKDFVEQNKNLTLNEMAEKWGNVSAKTIGNALKRIKFTVKKNV